MIYELKEPYEKVRPLFKEWKNPAIHAVIDRNNLGNIYVDTGIPSGSSQKKG